MNDVYRYALAVTGNTSDAEDVTQTTFMNAYRAFARGERPLKPQNWLMTIAHNVCRQRARLSARRPSEVGFDENLAEAPIAPDDVPSATDIRRALSHLPYAQRAALIMRELEGRSHAEIAEILGLTTPASEMLTFRARRALREHLAGTLTCTQAEDVLDRQGDGRLTAHEAGLLRAHLRECQECERLARRLRAQRAAWKALAVAPVPVSLRTFQQVGGTAATGLGAGVAAKVAAVTLAVATAGGAAVVAKHEIGGGTAQPRPRLTHVRAHRDPLPASHRQTTRRQTPTVAAPHVRRDVHPERVQALHPAHPAHPIHPVHPVHPVHPIHPAHPVHPPNARDPASRR